MLKLLVFASAIALALGDGHGAATTQDCDSAEANSCAECLCVSDKRKKKGLFCSHIFILTMFDGAKRDSNISNFELFIFLHTQAFDMSCGSEQQEWCDANLMGCK